MHFKARWRWFWNELHKTSGRMWLLVLLVSVFLMFGMFALLVWSGHYLN